MAKGKRKDWRHRVTRQELAERKFIDEKLDAAFQSTVDRAVQHDIEAINARFVASAAKIAATYAGIEAEAKRWIADAVPKLAKVFANDGQGAITGYLSEEQMKRMFGEQFMPLGGGRSIIGDLLLSQMPEKTNGRES